MRLCGQYFNSDVVNRIKATVESDLSISRSALSRQVCEWLDWRSPNGKLCEMSCRKALLELDKRGVIKLPETDQRIYFHQDQIRSRQRLKGLRGLAVGWTN